ncbi:MULTISPECIES: hypothetical protein [unclassified Meiothermus]|uniref:hypothetical protein n=1 Tax=unclassified Meiothermus TaxID=370471 RepID=UPI000D7CA7DB|nr:MULTISPECIES: hypothetical protein [unclassified Meiothermus]PZA08762.1 hypothetical protein DNA98_01580 [Meiothermus sp. Pnk-1]RYM40616.1 hypothetical protein EWH23_00360 [Meiothermus sp. PNK-Is4]
MKGVFPSRTVGLFSVLIAVLLLGARFAAFSVEANGDQQVDLATGVTTLPQGGTLTDNQNGLRLVAPYIQYKEGEFIRARQAQLSTGEARFIALELDYQFKGEILRLKEATVNSPDFGNISAQDGLALLGENRLVLSGNIRSQTPQLKAGKMVVDTQSRQALVIGAYTFQDGASRLSGNRPDSLLLLSFQGGKTHVTTRVPPEVLARLRPYADKL